MIQVSKVKKVFHNNGLQVSATAVNMIRDEFNRHINRMIDNLKENNSKRLTDKNYYLVNRP